MFPSKLLLGKDMFTLTFVDLENETRISIFWNLRNERSKIRLLPSFQLDTRLNSKKRNETSLLMNSDTLIVYEY